MVWNHTYSNKDAPLQVRLASELGFFFVVKGVFEDWGIVELVECLPIFSVVEDGRMNLMWFWLGIHIKTVLR